MNLREFTEKNEEQTLSEFATKSSQTAGRKRKQDKCEIRTEFQRDRDRIIHSKSFRRLMHKTQVFISPEDDHYRTRLTHTMEVSQIARTIARALRLNEDLTEAIALGHDLGHTPFGHTGEDALDSILENGFRHNEQGVRVVTLLEKNGGGLNLTHEVIDGIFNHRTGFEPGTLEGKIVQLSDKIAYINHDIDDAVRAGLLNPETLPEYSVDILGKTPSARINFLIRNVIENSYMKNYITLDKRAYDALYKLRAFLFETVYESQLQISERKKIKFMLKSIFDFFCENFELLPDYLKKNDGGKETAVCDFIAGMTDRYAFRLFNELIVPEAVK